MEAVMPKSRPALASVKFSALDRNTTARSALQSIIKHKTHGAIIESSHGSKFIGWQYIAGAARNLNDPLLGALDDPVLGHLTGIGSRPSTNRDPNAAVVMIDLSTIIKKISTDYLGIAPNYVCPKGDYQALNPGTCPYDGQTLKKQ
jgi:hypothetical protein